MTPALTEAQARKTAARAWAVFNRRNVVDPTTTRVADWLFVYEANGWRITLTEHFGRWLASEPASEAALDEVV